MTKKEQKQECACGCSCGKKAIVLLGGIAVSVLLAVGICKTMCCTTKTMVVDFERVQVEAEVYKSIFAEQRKYEEKLQAQLTLEAGELQKEEKELMDQKSKLKEVDFKKKSLALQKKVAETQQKYQLQAQQIVMATRLTAQKVQEGIKNTIEEVADKARADIVISKEVTVYSNDKADLTDAFIKALNEKVKPVAYPDPATINFTVGAQ